jgi:hypothetical protein
VAGRIRSIEKFNDLILNRSHDLQACSIMCQPTTPPRAPMNTQGSDYCRGPADWRPGLRILVGFSPYSFVRWGTFDVAGKLVECPPAAVPRLQFRPLGYVRQAGRQRQRFNVGGIHLRFSSTAHPRSAGNI